MAGLYRTHEAIPKNTKNYVSVGDPYYKKPTVNSRHKSKQFLTEPAKLGQTAGYFKKIEYTSAPYFEGDKYTVTEPRANRKMGFGSFEARRRDEFSLDIKARMYKERVKGETVYVDQVLQDATGLLGEEKTGEYVPSPDEAHLFQTQTPSFLYDVGKTAETPVCMKCNRDKFYCPHRAQVTQTDSARRPGEIPSQNTAYGDFNGEQVGKPKFGRNNVTRQFWDASHLSSAQ